MMCQDLIQLQMALALYFSFLMLVGQVYTTPGLKIHLDHVVEQLDNMIAKAKIEPENPSPSARFRGILESQSPFLS